MDHYFNNRWGFFLFAAGVFAVVCASSDRENYTQPSGTINRQIIDSPVPKEHRRFYLPLESTDYMTSNRGANERYKNARSTINDSSLLAADSLSETRGQYIGNNIFVRSGD